MKKAIRQAKIEQLINKFEISTQDELMEKLNSIQIVATQAAISRIFVKCKLEATRCYR